jgi:hypothetical protein
MTQLDAEWAISRSVAVERDAQGRPRYLAEIRGVPIWIVVALDEPDLIVTIYKRGRG